MSAERSGRNGFLVLNSVAVRERRIEEGYKVISPSQKWTTARPDVTTLPGVQLLTDIVEKCEENFDIIT